ncbi:hypothetical protein P43SY_006765 [Pythium insidiosum]|uniref:Uncharacterized protein n=1 Tax=Pythium insidiosum TaxID=114742 RepID=A0AAD5M9A6_PYTIN|nr:hypothetical protein P43SY_006765 [Pythium insidiosum]
MPPAKDVPSHTFVFRVKKMRKKVGDESVNPENAAHALVRKKERAARRLLIERRKAALEADEKLETEFEGKLSRDQFDLYRIVRDTIRRELRKTRKEFASSAARGDIVQLTERSLQALKEELVAFMINNPPADVMIASEIEALQRQAVNQVETSAERMSLINDSMQTIDRLILQSETKKGSLFDAFHGSAFKGYVHMADPKETLRALLKLAPPRPHE